MIRSLAKCPNWLIDRFNNAGGSVSFSQFMDWSLNDPINGAYGSGKLKVGKGGDFVTSPSLDSSFADLLSIQLVEWLDQLIEIVEDNKPISLIDIGPGEGDLSFDLICAIEKISPKIMERIELILVEPNQGMKVRQKNKLKELKNISKRWIALEDLKKDPVYGIVIAHEALDSFPVDRLIYKNQNLYMQGVALLKEGNEYFLDYIQLPLTAQLYNSIERARDKLGLRIPPDNVNDLWITEWHTSLDDWFKDLSSCLINGPVLIIDYMLKAKSYYNKSRKDGLLIGYIDQATSSSFLDHIGSLDITSHLCVETLKLSAKENSFLFLGERKQGLALLSLGLSEMLYFIQEEHKESISLALSKRETLLRLVDPYCLGDFMWIAFQASKNKTSSEVVFKTRFLNEPK